MRMVLLFLIIMASLGTNLAKSVSEEASMPDVVKESKGKDVQRSGNFGGGFNPGSNGASGFNPGNTGDEQPSKDDSMNNQENGGSEYNPGYTGGSGFYPGNNGGGGYKPEEEKPSTDESNGWNGGSGFHPGNNGGAGYKPGDEQPSKDDSNNNQGNGEYNPGYTGGSGFYPGNNGGTGYKPGDEQPSKDDSMNNQGNGQTGYNPGDQTPQIPDFVPDESVTNPGNGQTGYNPGDQTPHIPDFVPDESVTNPGNGQNGYNPGGSGFNPGNMGNEWSGGSHPGGGRPNRPDDNIAFPGNGNSGYNPGATEGSGSYPRGANERKNLPRNKTQFRTKIVFADDEDNSEPETASKPKTKSPYVPGGDKTPYLREKQTKPVLENDLPRFYLLQPVKATKPFGQTVETVFQPQISVGSAQTLPSQIQFASPSSMKEPKPFPSPILFKASKQTKPFQAEEKDTPSYFVLSPVGHAKNNYNPQIFAQNPSSGIIAQTVPSPIQFDGTVIKAPYVPGENKQQYLRGRQTTPFQVQENETEAPKYILLNPIRVTRPFQGQIVDGLKNTNYNPQILVQNPTSGIFAQTLPNPIQFDQTVSKAPYVPGQNKQQYLRGRQTKPFQSQEQEQETPRYILLNPLKQTRPSPIQVATSGYSPQILVQNPVSGIFAQTLPSPIQFDQTLAKAPYVPGENKQQYLRGRQPIIFAEETLTKNKLDPQIVIQNPNSGTFVQTLPSPIQFDSTVAKAPYVPGQNKQQYLRGRQTKPFQVQEEATKYALLNLRQTKPFSAAGQNIVSAKTLPQQPIVEDSMLASRARGDFLPGAATRPNFPPGYNPAAVSRNAPPLPEVILFPSGKQTKPFLRQQPAAEETILASRATSGFLPGVSTKPRYPPGFAPPAVARTAQTQEVPDAGYGGPKTVLYIF